jgi:predicted ATPase
VDTQGDALFVAFPTAPGALAAAAEAQKGLAAGPIRVRMGLHTGTPLLGEEGYVGVDVHRAARIAAAGHGGQVLVSSATAALANGEALRDLGEHRLKDLAAAERIYQLGEGEFPPLRSLAHSNLPVPATPFLGREKELASVVALLMDRGARLLTLTGPGGSGKTRLALQATAEAADRFRDGIVWVPLAALRDATLVAGAVAAAAEIDQQPGRTIEETLSNRLAGKEMLFLLDNAEHLLPNVAETIGLLRDLGGPTTLVTSRERLRLQGEHAWPVPPLSPEDGVSLFVARARAVDPSFRATGALDDLCEHLDELPLAIELAAARTGVFTADQLLERIGRRLDVLKGMRDADPRQQTLRATIEWSHELLDPEEQRVLADLSVFAGGCTLDAAGDVCDADVDTLESLIDKSLLRRFDSLAGARYGMLGAIRDFASEQLEQTGRAPDVGDREAAWAAALCDELWEWRRDDRQGDAFVRFTAEEGNLRVAESHVLAGGDADRAHRLARVAGFFFILGGRASDAAASLERALAIAGPADPLLRIDTLRTLVFVSVRMGARPRAVSAGEEAVALGRECGDEEALGGALGDLGMALDKGDTELGKQFYEEAIAVLRRIGVTRELTGALHNYAGILVLDGRYEEAEELFAETLELQATASPWGPWGYALCHLNLAEVACFMGRPDEATPHIREAFVPFRDVGDRAGLASCLFMEAAVAAARGEAHRAGILLAVVDEVFAEVGEHQESTEVALRDAIFDRASAEEREALREGARTDPLPTLEQAVAETFPDL